MHVVVTGGSGFLGARLTRQLLAAGAVTADGQSAPLDRLTSIDLVPPPDGIAADPRVTVLTGDLLDLFGGVEAVFGKAPATSAAAPIAGADVVFHLASAVSAECEADFDLGIRANLGGGLGLIQAIRQLDRAPVFVLASSLAVFGRSPADPLPEVVTDSTPATPMTSYGTQKAMLEHLVADATRKGFVRGRSVRLMTVSVRPGRPNGAASGFLSGIVREPLAGQRSTAPVPPETSVALSSPGRTIEGLLRAAAVTQDGWGSRVALNLPSVTTTVAGMVDALAEVAGPRTAELVDWHPDPAVTAIIASWPARFDTPRAAALGLQADPDFRTLIEAYRREN